MKVLLVLCIMLASSALFAGAVNGMVAKKSPHSVHKTLDRLTTILQKKGITVFARVEHSKAANALGIKLRDTELVIFGNPKLGSHFFTSKQTAGIDLPMKAVAWKDASGQVWLGYNDPQYVADRHGIDDRAKMIAKMRGALQKLTDKATQP